MWVKICGATTAEAVDAALAAGADALGFVFAHSVRQLTPAQASLLAGPARGRVRCVAVTRHPERAALAELLTTFRPDVLQTDGEDFAAITLPEGVEGLPVWRAGLPRPAAMPRRLLFEGPASGAGVIADWREAAAISATGVELILAGGLTPDNVAEAIRAVRPYGVDVSSGVESAPGDKNPAKIAQFITAARAAARESEAK